MNTVDHLLWLSQQVAAALATVWYVTLPCVLIGAWGVGRIVRLEGGVRTAGKTLLLAALPPILVLSVGTALRAPNPGQAGGSEYWVLGLALISLMGFLALIATARGSRLETAAILIPSVWPLLLAVFVASMSIAGDWV